MALGPCLFLEFAGFLIRKQKYMSYDRSRAAKTASQLNKKHLLHSNNNNNNDDDDDDDDDDKLIF